MKTAEELLDNQIQSGDISYGRWGINIESVIQFAQVYARELIESLTDEEIDDMWGYHITKNDSPYVSGAEWAREELLKRIK